MQKTKFKRHKSYDGEYYWRLSKVDYRRISGGLAFAGRVETEVELQKPGWLVVLAEERIVREDGRRHIIVTYSKELVGAELEPFSVQESFEEASACGLLIPCPKWVTPLEQGEVALLPHFNRERGRFAPRLSLINPPLWDGSAFLKYDRLLELRLNMQKTLHFGAENSALADAMARVTPYDKIRPLPEYPATAALLYALAYLDLTTLQGVEKNTSLVVGKAGY